MIKFNEIILETEKFKKTGNKNLDVNYQLDINQIFDPGNIKSIIKLVKNSPDYNMKGLVLDYLEKIQNIGIKRFETVRLTIEK